ncbi:unnamed protein product [Symbiodinium microadriaticum]|nr:unnamed protein product [Symbiodinium microadriaticum]
MAKRLYTATPLLLPPAVCACPHVNWEEWRTPQHMVQVEFAEQGVGPETSLDVLDQELAEERAWTLAWGTKDAGFVALQSEVEMMRMLPPHPNIVGLLGELVDDDGFVVPFCPGGSVGEEPDIQQMVVQLRPGEVAQMRMAVEETTSTEYLYRGELQEPEAAKRHLHAAAEAWMSSAQERPHKQARSHRVYNTADKDVQPWYKKWTCRLVSWDELVVQVRQDMAEFTQAAAAATDPSELDTQAPTVPATLQYESWSGEGAAVDIDNAETVPMGIFPESAPQWKLRVDVLRRCGEVL